MSSKKKIKINIISINIKNFNKRIMIRDNCERNIMKSNKALMFKKSKQCKCLVKIG